MPRNLVIFCDGTWNSAAEEEYGTPTPTNVARLYDACLGEAESGGKQVTWYEPGVGALGSRTKRAWEGATGQGIGANIRRAYTAIARNYVDGDKVFLFGFSRGAFTARSVAGMVQRVGLIQDPTRERVEKAYSEYQKRVWAPDTETGPDNPKLGKRFANVRIHFIGVWETVGALGLPLWGWSFNLRHLYRNGFHELSPNAVTDFVYHALAMDEKRTSFMPNLWELPKTAKEARPTVEQVWFRGVHSDVGGGYPDHGLADIALKWMKLNAESHGLLVRSNALILPALDPAARVHDSYRGPLWGNVAGWPRWYPPMNRSSSAPDAEANGYLHDSVLQRERHVVSSGGKEWPLRTLAIDESATIDVVADTIWNNSGLILEKGAYYDFKASGWWQDRDDTPAGPEGQPPADESRFKRFLRFGRRAPKQRWMKLIALVNHPRPWPWRELPITEAIRYFVIEDPKILVDALVPIGAECLDFQAHGTGVLWLFANDWWKYYANNTGSITVTVTRRR